MNDSQLALPSHIYLQYNMATPFNLDKDYMNKLFCTFSSKNELEGTLETIQSQYKILFNKIFVLYIELTNEYVCTYNVDSGNMSNSLLENTILLHRKKESNTLYTINALNQLVKEENGGVLDNTFMLDWNKFKNSIILTNTQGTKRIQTRVFEVIEFK